MPGKPLSKKEKKDLAKSLGTGGARKAADAMINRHKVLEDAINGSYTPPKKKK